MVITPRDVFRHRSIARIAAVLADAPEAGPVVTDLVTLTADEAAEVSGEVLPLTPLQSGLLFLASLDTRIWTSTPFRCPWMCMGRLTSRGCGMRCRDCWTGIPTCVVPSSTSLLAAG
jgi:hypothetical protein